jgi:hypothetical protein
MRSIHFSHNKSKRTREVFSEVSSHIFISHSVLFLSSSEFISNLYLRYLGNKIIQEGIFVRNLKTHSTQSQNSFASNNHNSPQLSLLVGLNFTSFILCNSSSVIFQSLCKVSSENHLLHFSHKT